MTTEDKNSRLSQSIDCVDSLIRMAGTDYELTASLTLCRTALAAISWERFRLRHEELSRRGRITRRRASFTARHKRGNRIYV